MSGLLRLPSGLNFNASGGNTLSNYDIVSFNPVYVPDTGSFGSVTYNIQDGEGVRIGNYFFYKVALRTSEITQGTASGTIRVGGFPYTAESEWVANVGDPGRLGSWVTTPLSAVTAAGILSLVKLPSLGGAYSFIGASDLLYESGNRNYLRLTGMFEIN